MKHRDETLNGLSSDDLSTDEDSTTAAGARRRRWTIRLRTTVLATVIFVVFGIAMALIARSAVVHLVTAQRAAVAESALGRVLNSAGSASEVAAIESDPSVHLVFTDGQGREVTYQDFLSFVSSSGQPLDEQSLPAGGVASAAVGGTNEGAPIDGTIVFSVPGTGPDASVSDSAIAFAGPEGEWSVRGVAATVSHGDDGITASSAIWIGDSAMNVAVTSPSIGDALSIFDRTMILLIAVLAIGVAAMSWFSVSFALRPVEAIRRQVARTDPSDLSHHVPRPETGDEIDRLATTMNDLLDRLHRASIEQKRFVSDASHELRSPVTAALATIQTVDRSKMGPGWAEVETTLTDATIRLSTLIDDLFLMSTVEERRTCADPTAADVETDLDEIALGIAERPHRCSVAVRVDRPVRVRADRRLIDRCVTNLVDNATRYAQDSVLISVGVDAAGRPEVAVTDDGPGIPADLREAVFERFARLDQSRSSDGGGAGLGLPIARQIAEQQGATLVLADPGDEGGASFRLVFNQPVAAT